MWFLHEVKADEVGEYRILNVLFEKYFKEVGLEPDAINKWFAEYPYPLCIRYSTKDGIWDNELIHSKEEYYYFLDKVVFHKSENMWFTWYFSSLKERHPRKLRKCSDIEAMERARKLFVKELYYCTLCLLRDMDLQLTFIEKGAIMQHERDRLIWDKSREIRLVEESIIEFEVK